MKKLLVWFAEILADEVKKRLLGDDATVAVLNLQPGDRVILRVKNHLSDKVYERITQQVKELFPGHQVIVLEDGIEIFAGRDEENKIIVRYD